MLVHAGKCIAAGVVVAAAVVVVAAWVVAVGPSLHWEPVGTGQLPKHATSETMPPPASLMMNDAVPVAPPVWAYQVAPLLRCMVKLLDPTVRSALSTLWGRFEKMTLVYQALLPSSTVTTAPPTAVSHSTGS